MCVSYNSKKNINHFKIDIVNNIYISHTLYIAVKQINAYSLKSHLTRNKSYFIHTR
ncbi:hypothetical protein HanIR_Chr13g0657461 [Helianthus annuus]|nr:hypothetical protein HanIR_Chr13g0657461 [Helianthus annuus]